MRDEGVNYVAGHPLLNRRCTRLPGCIRLRNDLFCAGWGIVKLYSLFVANLHRSGIKWYIRFWLQPAKWSIVYFVVQYANICAA